MINFKLENKADGQFFSRKK